MPNRIPGSGGAKARELAELCAGVIAAHDFTEEDLDEAADAAIEAVANVLFAKAGIG